MVTADPDPDRDGAGSGNTCSLLDRLVVVGRHVDRHVVNVLSASEV